MQCRHLYSQLAKGLARTGFVWPGTLQKRMLTCGKPQCACHKDPKAHHGPYFYWTSKEQGKTISRKINQEEAEILEEWINNRRTIEAILKRMMKISEYALAFRLRMKNKGR
jgi:hypothetical protein